MGDQRVDDAAAAGDDHVLRRAAALHLGHEVTGQEGGVRPAVDAVERAGGDELLHRRQLPGEVVGAVGEEAGEQLPGRAAEQHDAGVEHRAEPELVPRHRRGVAEGPTAVRGAARAVGVLGHAVQRHELRHDDLAHLVLLGRDRQGDERTAATGTARRCDLDHLSCGGLARDARRGGRLVGDCEIAVSGVLAKIEHRWCGARASSGLGRAAGVVASRADRRPSRDRAAGRAPLVRARAARPDDELGRAAGVAVSRRRSRPG